MRKPWRVQRGLKTTAHTHIILTGMLTKIAKGIIALLILAGCSQYRDSFPYFVGEFEGYYRTTGGGAPVGLVIQTSLGEVTQNRYMVSGTAALGEQSYTVSGREDAGFNLGYLSPQALPPLGELVLYFKDESGTVTYSLCADINYETEEIRSYAFPSEAFLYEGDCAAVRYEIYEEDDFYARVQLTKIRP